MKKKSNVLVCLLLLALGGCAGNQEQIPLSPKIPRPLDTSVEVHCRDKDKVFSADITPPMLDGLLYVMIDGAIKSSLANTQLERIQESFDFDGLQKEIDVRIERALNTAEWLKARHFHKTYSNMSEEALALRKKLLEEQDASGVFHITMRFSPDMDVLVCKLVFTLFPTEKLIKKAPNNRLELGEPFYRTTLFANAYIPWGSRGNREDNMDKWVEDKCEPLRQGVIDALNNLERQLIRVLQHPDI